MQIPLLVYHVASHDKKGSTIHNSRPLRYVYIFDGLRLSDIIKEDRSEQMRLPPLHNIYNHSPGFPMTCLRSTAIARVRFLHHTPNIER